jgi:hypothetical protein
MVAKDKRYALYIGVLGKHLESLASIYGTTGARYCDDNLHG